MNWTSRAGLPLLVAATVCCRGVTPTQATGIGNLGGTFIFFDGAVVVVVPPNALSDIIQLTVTRFVPIESLPPSPTLVPGTALDFGPDGVQFATPIQVTINYDAFLLPPGVRERELSMYKAVNGQWEAVPGAALDQDAGTVTVTLPSLSTYGLLGAPAASIDVAPALVAIPAGTTQQLGAAVYDASATLLPDRVVSWSSSDTSRVTVDSTGLVRGLRTGSATVTASVEAAFRDVPVTVSDTSAPPGPDPAPWFEENFSTYTSTADMLLDPRSIYFEGEQANTPQIVLDQTVGLPLAGLTQSLKYTFPDRTVLSNRCADYSISRTLILPLPVQELWMEFYLLFPQTFRTRAPVEWGCTSNPDYKMLFGVTNVSRFEVKTGADGAYWKVGSPFNEAQPTGRQVREWDGMWHRYRVHWKLGLGNGIVQFWIDNELVYQRTNFNNQTAPAIYRIRLGGNMNQGPDSDMPYWWGRVRVWNANPGWGATVAGAQRTR